MCARRLAQMTAGRTWKNPAHNQSGRSRKPHQEPRNASGSPGSVPKTGPRRPPRAHERPRKPPPERAAALRVAFTSPRAPFRPVRGKAFQKFRSLPAPPGQRRPVANYTVNCSFEHALRRSRPIYTNWRPQRTHSKLMVMIRRRTRYSVKTKQWA